MITCIKRGGYCCKAVKTDLPPPTRLIDSRYFSSLSPSLSAQGVILFFLRPGRWHWMLQFSQMRHPLIMGHFGQARPGLCAVSDNDQHKLHVYYRVCLSQHRLDLTTMMMMRFGWCLKCWEEKKTLVAYKIFINSHLTGLIAMKGWAANFTRKLADN